MWFITGIEAYNGTVNNCIWLDSDSVKTYNASKTQVKGFVIRKTKCIGTRLQKCIN